MNKRESILKAALELLVKNGIHATPMSAIAKAAKTGMGTIYNYFDNKDILINAIYVEIKEQEEIILIALTKDQPIKTQFEDYYRSVIDFYLDNPLFFYFMQQLQASPIITAESKKVGYRAVDSVIRMLERGQRERIIKDINTRELLQFMGGAILSFVRWHLDQAATSRETTAMDNQLRMVWDAIKE